MIWTLGIVFCIVVLVIGCSKKENSRKENIEEQKYIKTFGEYCVSKQWIENKEHSTDDMFFYVKEGTEKQRNGDRTFPGKMETYGIIQIWIPAG